MFTRTLEINKKYSSFLFGARSTGKTTLLNTLFPSNNTLLIDLLDTELEDKLSRTPSLLKDILNEQEESISHIIIDEIQKIPRLLDVIHQYIQQNEGKYYFILTGSSAKKLKAGGADLLAGRAFVFNLFPLTFRELEKSFNLNDYLCYGGLPAVYNFETNQEREKFLKAYGLMYLKEEIWNEHIVRKLDPFRSFLEVAAATNGEILNYKKISDQIKVDSKTIASYYNILTETLLGFTLNSYNTSIRKQLISSPKFYFIDTGIKRALDNTLKIPLAPKTFAYGKAFEHFIICQLFFIIHYFETDDRLYYLKTKDGAEIDLIIEHPNKNLVCIEIKSTDDSTLINTSNLRNLAKDLDCDDILCLSQDPVSRSENDVSFLHWERAIEKLYPIK